MNISNIYTTQNFSGVNLKKSTDNTSMKDKLKKMVPEANKALAGKTEREVPENGKFTPAAITYQLPQSPNKVRIKVEHDEKEYQNQRRLSVGVHHQNSDRLTSEYLTKGTKNEIINYLADDKNTEEMVDVILKLSEKTDNYYNSL